MKAVEIRNVSFSYGDRKALTSVSFDVETGKTFCLLGPNGGGKSTLLSILSTFQKPQQGSVIYFENPSGTDPRTIRASLGVVFQNPALDGKLSVRENLLHHGHLYQVARNTLVKRCDNLLNFLGLADRGEEKVATLSGGLKRRVEIAKSLIHRPKLLILDEPTTGLDPIVRKDLWRDLKRQQETEKTTILFTTHLLEEADAADRVALLDQGNLVAEGTPADLKASVGSETVSLKCKNVVATSNLIEKELGVKPIRLENEVRLQCKDSASLIEKLIRTYRNEFDSLTLGTATLEDLFVLKTGRRLAQ